MHLLASTVSDAMFGAGVLMLVVILLRRFWRYQRKTKKEKTPVSRRQLDTRQDKPLLDAPPEIIRWHVEMHETARDLKAELDSKMSALQGIVRIANEESARLEAAIARAEQLGISPYPDTLAAIEGLNATADAGALVLPESPPVSEGDPVGTQLGAVYQLADQGLAPSAIARSLGTSLGDVELIMSLRPESTS